MFIALIIGLVILNILFGVKLVELKRGGKIVLRRFRAKADEWLTYYWKQVCWYVERGLVRMREVWLTTQWSARRWLAEKLRKLSRYLHS